MAADMVVWENLVRALGSAIALLADADELMKLKVSLEKDEVKGALAVVAARKMMDDEATRSRVENLVALLHEADDLIDELVTLVYQKKRFIDQLGDYTGVSRRHVLYRTISKLRQEVIHFFPSNPNNYSSLLIKVDVPLKKISKGLEQLNEQLRHKFSNKDTPDTEFKPCSSEIAKHRVIGRDIDRETIINMLLQPQNDNEAANFSVIPIVGLPGLGKSALAKFVYDEEKVRNHFDLRMWIQVSQIDDEKEIIREIVESCTSSKSTYGGNYHQMRAKDHGSLTDQNVVPFRDLLGCRSLGSSVVTPNCRTSKDEIDILERRIRREIDGKLYLLVLDDVSIKQWPRLKGLLARGAKGSQILVTTRHFEVADLVKSKTDRIYELQGLSVKNSLTLLEESALGNVNESESESESELKTTGKSIVEMCNGVPLTIRVLGGLLYGKSENMWLSVKKDIKFQKEHGNEKEVMDHILEHSYNDLPTRLKACIGYCSLFPEHFEFSKHDLISLWTAQGFVDPQHHGELEEVGEMYFMELSRRYFFQEASTDYLGNVVTCKMHPLMYNLAHKNAAGVAIVYLADNGVCEEALDSACKHVSFNCNRGSSIKVPPSLLQVQGLRTVLSVKEPDCKAKLEKSACNMLISKLRSLRVLDLHDLGIEELPDCIGYLIHLRYLDLSENDLPTLPKSVTDLYNLQTLKLNSCSKLTRLVGNYGELVSLKRFELDECDSLSSMPLGLGKLTKLTTLSRFVVGKDGSIDMPDVGLKALEQLINLRGRLEIELRGDWMGNVNEASEAHMHSKSQLTELKITWSQPITTDTQKSSNHLSVKDKLQYQKLLGDLRPHENLKILCIEGYKGSYFPKWDHAEDKWALSLPNLVVVSIEGCDKCEHLPPFGELPLLKRLILRHMSNVQFVEGDGSSRDSSSTPFFESLEELTLHNFYKLERWRKEVIFPTGDQPPVHYFRKLSKLRIWNCPNLTTMPLFPNVVELDLRNVNQKLLEGLARSTANEKNVSLKSLQIKRCPNLKSFRAVKEGLGDLPCIEQLVIDRCDALTSLASELKGLTSLKTLEISSCKELDLSSEDGSNHKDNNSNTTASRRSSQRDRRRTLARGQISKIPWASLKNLRQLTLKDIPKMKTLPEGLKHVKTLKFLWLSACYALTELPEWIDSLKVLQHLRIESCSALTRLPDGIQEVKSLMKVEITECPELMERCREHEGEDWHKIKHARILLHRSWRYGLISELGSMHNKSRLSNVKTVDNVKYFIIPAIPAEDIL